MALVASFAPSLRSGANDATRATNKQYALQKSSYCPIRFLQLQDSLPDAQSCFNIILLPVKYDKTEEFNKAMLTSLRYASCSFASGF